jgi:hypothetical protein
LQTAVRSVYRLPVTIRGVLRGVTILALLLATAPAGAAGDMEKARALFQKGQTDFALGKFLDAVQSFEEAYREVPRPELLWNMAKAYRKQYDIDRDVNHLRRAKVLYRNYAELATNGKERTEAHQEEEVVEGELRQVEQTNGSLVASSTRPGTAQSRLPGVRNPSETQPGTTVPPGAAVGTPEGKQEQQKPLVRRWWLWTAIGGAAAVGLGVGLGVGLTQSGGAAPPSTNGGNYNPF